jgi:hypothetical protein
MVLLTTKGAAALKSLVERNTAITEVVSFVSKEKKFAHMAFVKGRLNQCESEILILNVEDSTAHYDKGHQKEHQNPVCPVYLKIIPYI